MSFSSLFAGKVHANVYKSFRPAYSEHIFKYIRQMLEQWNIPSKTVFSVAVDLGCGNGQATSYLPATFDYVAGVDVSQAQLDEAKKDGICALRGDLLVGNETELPFKSSTVDFIQVFQAAHWFNHKNFYREVDRILKPGGALLLSVYGMGSIRSCDNLSFEDRLNGKDKIEKFNADHHTFYEFLKSHGYFPDAIRNDVDKLYAGYSLPYTEHIRCYDIRMAMDWKIDDIVGYFRSWSGWQQYCTKTGDSSMLDNFEKKWKKDFGDNSLIFSWPMGLHFARKPGKV